MFGFFKSRVPSKPVANKIVLEKIITSRSKTQTKTNLKDANEIAASAATVYMQEILGKSQIDLLHSGPREKNAISILSLVASDCTSRMIDAKFEIVALMTLSQLFSKTCSDADLGALLLEAIRTFNRLTQDITKDSPIAQFGQASLGFLKTNNDSMLENIGEMFPLFVELLAEKV